MNKQIQKAKKALPKGWLTRLQLQIFNRTGIEYHYRYVSQVLRGKGKNMIILQEFITLCREYEAEKAEVTNQLKWLVKWEKYYSEANVLKVGSGFMVFIVDPRQKILST